MPQRVLALGDVHGCSRALDALLAVVQPTFEDVFVALGDYVDRGPDTKGVIDRLIRLSSELQVVPLLGNHEQMMLDARDRPWDAGAWLRYGGREALASYAPSGEEPSFDHVPEDHWLFFEDDCVDWHEIDTHFFVHASAYCDLDLADQPVQMLRWERFGDPPPHRSGKIMVCGHTSQKSGWPRDIGHAVCIDTHAYGGGWLTCLDVKSGKFWQANQLGETRVGCLQELASQPAE
ncbi:MAG: metallophosphoesterase family protein [Gemmataceae bacterium]